MLADMPLGSEHGGHQWHLVCCIPGIPPEQGFARQRCQLLAICQAARVLPLVYTPLSRIQAVLNGSAQPAGKQQF